jgi:hypothetical protein
MLLSDLNAQELLFLHLIFISVLDWGDPDVLFGDLTYEDKPQAIYQWVLNYIKTEHRVMSEICYKEVKEWIKDQMCNPN